MALNKKDFPAVGILDIDIHTAMVPKISKNLMVDVNAYGI